MFSLKQISTVVQWTVNDIRKNIYISWVRAWAHKAVRLWNGVSDAEDEVIGNALTWLSLLSRWQLSMLDMSQTCESWAWNLCIGLAGKSEGLSCPVEACLVPSVALSLPSTPEQVQLRRQLSILPCLTIRISFWPPPQVCCPEVLRSVLVATLESSSQQS